MDLMEHFEPTYEDLKEYYDKYFSFRQLNVELADKLILISLVGFLTKQARKSKPEVSCLKVLQKICDPTIYKDDKFIKGIAVTCENFLSTSNGEFPLFGLKSSKEIVKQVKTILDNYLPF